MMSRAPARFNDSSASRSAEKLPYLRASADHIGWLTVDVVEAAASFGLEPRFGVRLDPTKVAFK